MRANAVAFLASYRGLCIGGGIGTWGGGVDCSTIVRAA